MRLRRRNAPSSPRSLQRSASANSIRFSLAENCRRVAISITSGSGLCASKDSMLEDRADSIEEIGEIPFIEDFDTWVMTGYYLYSKLLRSGVSRHIGTGGADLEERTHQDSRCITIGSSDRAGRVFGKPRRGSMVGINQLRLMIAQPRVAQPHR